MPRGSDIEMSVKDLHIQTMRRTAAMVIVIAVFWMAVGFYLQNGLMWAIAGMVGLGTTASVALTLRGYRVAGRITWHGIGLAAVNLGAYLVHPAGNVEVMYVALLGGPFMTISLKHERNLLLSLLGLILLSWAVFRVLGPGIFGVYLIGEEMAAQYVAPGSTATTLAVIAIELYSFAWNSQLIHERMRGAMREAQAASKAKSEFLAAMSHEIRTPMNGVVGMVEILETSTLTQEQRRILQTVRESSFSLLRIIEDILDMSRIEAGRLELVPAEMDLQALAESAVDALRSYADAHNVRLLLQVDPALPATILADPGRLRQVLINIVGNAIKFSRRPADEPPGNADLSLSMTEDGLLRIVCHDDGIGIAPEFQARLFQPFQQSETVTSRRFGGSGLGLAIVDQLIRQMGGTITVHSLLGQGATFTVVLPVDSPTAPRVLPDLAGRRVLIADNLGCGAAALAAQVVALGGEPALMDAAALRIEAVQAADEPVFVLADGDPLAASPAFQSVFPPRRLLRLTRDRTSPHGMVGRSIYSLQADPILPSEAVAGLDALLGLSLTASQQAADAGAAGVAHDARHGGADPSGADGAGGWWAAATAPAPGGPDADTPSAALHILVAEDNEINQMVIARQLEQLGHQATIVDDGRAALDQWTAGRFDLVLTDCHMPEMDGFAMTGAIRRAERQGTLRRTPIVAITANALAGEGQRCLDAGMDAYLAKPVRLSDLRVTLERLAASGGRAARQDQPKAAPNPPAARARTA